MENRIGHTVATQNATTPITTDFAGRSARSLYAESRRYASAARNMFEGRYDGIDSTGRAWTTEDLYAHSAQCRRAGDAAQRRENRAAAWAAFREAPILTLWTLTRGLPWAAERVIRRAYWAVAA